MISQLRCRLHASDLLPRLMKLAADAPSSAPVSLRLELGQIDTDWLDLLPGHGSFWYRARPDESEFHLGIGHALQIASTGANRFAALDSAFTGLCQHWQREGDTLAFAGFAFDSTHNTPLPNALLAIPAILLEARNGQCSATLSTPAGRIHEAIAEWQRLLLKPASTPHHDKRLAKRPENLLERAWIARVNVALREISSGRIDKIVLSRSRRLEASTTFSPVHILGNLIEQQPASLIYAHGNGQQTFLGATPERLVCLQRNQLSADALAGTAWPGSAELAGQKNQHEQSLVVRAVCQALQPLCPTPPQVSPAREHPAGHLQHLRSQITATVHPETTLFDLLRALHPTPAVGGFPVNAALEWLSKHGEQRPAWYSGGFGILTPDGDGEFSVALRSALLDGNVAELQAGAGIVAGSDPAQELAETEAKLGTMLNALGPIAFLQKNGTRY